MKGKGGTGPAGFHYCEMKIQAGAPPMQVIGRLAKGADPAFTSYTHTHTHDGVIRRGDVVQ